MRILMAYFSWTGYTEKLANYIEQELKSRGHEVIIEKIQAVVTHPHFTQVKRDISKFPSIGLGLISKRWHQYHIRNYKQAEDDIQPLQFPDISQFDAICVGSPKWVQISFPVARYLNSVQGTEGKKFGFFATFAGPPVQRFELDLIFKTMERIINRRGGNAIGNFGLSSMKHPSEYMIPIFKLASLLSFRKPLKEFTFGTQYAKEGILNFCDKIEEVKKES